MSTKSIYCDYGSPFKFFHKFTLNWGYFIEKEKFEKYYPEIAKRKKVYANGIIKVQDFSAVDDNLRIIPEIVLLMKNLSSYDILNIHTDSEELARTWLFDENQTDFVCEGAQNFVNEKLQTNYGKSEIEKRINKEKNHILEFVEDMDVKIIYSGRLA